MTRGSIIIWGKDELTRAPAPDAEHIRRDFNSACGAVHLPSRLTRLHGVRGKEDHASFPDRPFLAQFAIDVMAVLFAVLFVAVTGCGLGFALFWFLFV